MRLRTAVVGALVAALLLPASASAGFHLMKIREVYPGAPAHPTSQFIELQMHSAGQNVVGGHSVTVYSFEGAENATATFGGSVANGQNQRSILIASPDFEGEFGITPDLVINAPMLDRTGGAVCFEGIDCVAWGAFADATPETPLPGAVGSNAAAIPEGSSLVRTIEPGCETLLEGSDDSDDSATDFFTAAPPTPRNNATAPDETECDTSIDGASLAAKSKQKAKKAKVKATVGAGEDVTVAVSAKGKAGGKRVKFKPRSVDLAAGQTARATLKAVGKAKKAIRRAAKRGKATKVTVTARFTDPAGNTELLRKRVKLK